MYTLARTPARRSRLERSSSSSVRFRRSRDPRTVLTASCVQISRIGQCAVPDECRGRVEYCVPANPPARRQGPRLSETSCRLFEPAGQRLAVQLRHMFHGCSQQRVPARPGQGRRTGEDGGLFVGRQRVESPGKIVQNSALDVGVIPPVVDGVRVLDEAQWRSRHRSDGSRSPTAVYQERSTHRVTRSLLLWQECMAWLHRRPGSRRPQRSAAAIASRRSTTIASWRSPASDTFRNAVLAAASMRCWNGPIGSVRCAAWIISRRASRRSCW